MKFPTVPCTLCDEQPDLQRRAMGELLDGLEQRFPSVRQSILRALGDVRPDHLLDRNLHDFSKNAAGSAEPVERVERKKLPLV
ncbi:hypothetical protein HY251_05990 [bacterium]|nr:hypothetical protein [bacterium]